MQVLAGGGRTRFAVVGGSKDTRQVSRKSDADDCVDCDDNEPASREKMEEADDEAEDESDDWYGCVVFGDLEQGGCGIK